MKVLRTLSPAEILLLRDGNNAVIQDVFKYTFCDLLLKGVLAIKAVSKAFPREKQVKYYKYVIAENGLFNYHPKPHEETFLSPFYKSNSLKILFPHYIKMIYQTAESEKKYKSLIIKSSDIKKLTTQSIFQKFFGGFTLNSQGQQMISDFHREVESLNAEVKTLLKTDKPKYLEVIRSLNGNVFLIENLDYELLRQIDEEINNLLNREKRKKQEDYWDNGFDAIIDFSGGTDLSDSGFDFGGGDFGGGGSGGDFGCSGCSGCGGCGGD